jgi:hypothetical protein
MLVVVVDAPDLVVVDLVDSLDLVVLVVVEEDLED